MNRLFEFAFIDRAYRFKAYSLSGTIALICALVGRFSLNRDEKVILRMMAIVVCSLVTLFMLRYIFARKASAPEVSAPAMPSLRYLALAIAVVLSGFLGISAQPKIVSRVQAAIINQRLQKAVSSLEPDKAARLPNTQLKSRFQRVTSIADTSIQYKIPASPDVVEKLKNNLGGTLNAVSPGQEDVRRSGVTAFVALVAYARANNVLLAVNVPTILLPHGETGNSLVSQVPLKNGAGWWQGSPQGNTIIAMPTPISEPVFPISHSSAVFNGVNFNAFGSGRPFVGTDNESQVAVMNATIQAASQKLDSIVWMDIKFQNSRIIYDGGPLYLGNVAFENCQFQFGSDPESQKVLAEIRGAANQPVTIASGL